MTRITLSLSKVIFIGSAIVCTWNHFIHRHVFFEKPFIASWPIIWSLDSIVIISAGLIGIAILTSVKRKEVVWPLLTIVLCTFTIRNAVLLIQMELSQVDEPDRK